MSLITLKQVLWFSPVNCELFGSSEKICHYYYLFLCSIVVIALKKMDSEYRSTAVVMCSVLVVVFLTSFFSLSE